MILEPADVLALPLAAALFDREGRQVAATREWPGRTPGAAGYATGAGHLVVAAEGVPRELDAIMSGLLAELAASGADMSGGRADRLELLRAGLELVSGRPPDAGRHPAERVLEMFRAGLPARAPGLGLEVDLGAGRHEVPSPGAIALALLQLAVNARRHESAELIRLRLAAGPTFYVEWPAGRPQAATVDSHRHLVRRLRWGWGYVQMVTDALGGVALPPGPTSQGWEGAALGLGFSRLALPLAAVRDGRVERTTPAWEQDRDSPAVGASLSGQLLELAAEADRSPGRVIYRDLHRARAAAGLVWLALAPETGSSRARDVLRGLEHERVLWSAPEPHATRVHALAALLGTAMGDPWPTAPPRIWDQDFPAACAALGLDCPAHPDVLLHPDPRLAAFLLTELGGSLVEEAEAMTLLLPGRIPNAGLAGALGLVPAGRLRLA